MKPIFFKKPFIQFRVIVAIILSFSLLFLESQYNEFNKIKVYLNTFFSPLSFLINDLQKIFSHFSDFLIKQEKLIFENERLKKKILIIEAKNLLFEQIKVENMKLRELLHSPIQKKEHIIATQVLANIKNNYYNQVIIDKGFHHGVYQGQPVVNDKGVIGQVIEVEEFNSRVLLICDIKHALPVQILPNNIRVIANGVGCNYDLKIKITLDDIKNINLGDIIVTSGLGSRFPEGYPVATVSSIKEKKGSYVVIYAKHNVNFKNLQYLLLWSNSGFSQPLSSREVCKIANKRLVKKIR